MKGAKVRSIRPSGSDPGWADQVEYFQTPEQFDPMSLSAHHLDCVYLFTCNIILPCNKQRGIPLPASAKDPDYAVSQFDAVSNKQETLAQSLQVIRQRLLRILQIDSDYFMQTVRICYNKKGVCVSSLALL